MIPIIIPIIPLVANQSSLAITTIQNPIDNRCLPQYHSPQNFQNNCDDSIISQRDSLITESDSENKLLPEDAKSEKKLSSSFVILPLGVNLGQNNVIPSTTVKGLEDGKNAIDFDNWLIPWADVVTALDLKITQRSDGTQELRTFGSLLIFDPKILVNDSDIGQAISVGNIKNLLNVETSFDIGEYAIVFTPSWLGKNFGDRRYLQPEIPISLEGLPQINPPLFNLTGINQRTNFNQNEQSSFISGDNNNIDSEYQVLGSLFGGSLFTQINQNDQTLGNEWSLDQLQYFLPSPYQDYLIGTQSPFWDRVQRSNNDYLGFTFIQRFNYTPPNDLGFSLNGIEPQQRLSSSQVQRTISGKAEPGTVVQLVTTNGNLIVQEQLVDNSGEYRFENVITSDTSFQGIGRAINYKLLLFPQGDLSAKPEEIALTYRNLPGQLNPGKSALVVTGGTARDDVDNTFFGGLSDFKGGAGYYFGLTDQLTLGAGSVYDEGLKAYTEFIYQPQNIPLAFRVGVLTGSQINFTGDISFISSPFIFSFGGDEESQNLSLSYEFSRQFRLFSQWNSGDDEGLEFGFNTNLNSLFLSLSYETDNYINGSLIYRLNPVLFSFRKRRERTYSELIYNLSGQRLFTSSGFAFRGDYEIDDDNNLATINLLYRTPLRAKDGRSLLDLEIGYGFGSQGNGLVSSASTTLIPGLGLRLTYGQVSLSDNNSSLNIGLFTSLLLQPNISLDSQQNTLTQLRGKGMILIEPFLDKNNNGKRDNGEDFVTEDLELIFLINNQPISQLGVSSFQNVSTGALFQVPPGNYRIDLDSAGFPVGSKAQESAFAVKVVAGNYTRLRVPLIASYVMAGKVTDSDGKARIGVRVDAISVDNPTQKFTSVTNSAGIYYLEGLEKDTYNLFINGIPATPSLLKIDEKTSTFFELNLL